MSWTHIASGPLSLVEICPKTEGGPGQIDHISPLRSELLNLRAELLNLLGWVKGGIVESKSRFVKFKSRLVKYLGADLFNLRADF